MPSNALNNFELRLKEIEQILNAHTALLRFHRAAAAANNAGGLANVASVVNHLVATPGPGRPPRIQALNKAAIALLSGHLQGFVTDLYCESASALLTGHVANLKTVTDAAPTRGNPNSDNIRKLFATLGFGDVLDGMCWRNCSNQSAHKRLRDFNELRNKIVHGASIKVAKYQVTSYRRSWSALANWLDEKLRSEIEATTGNSPW